MTAQQRPYARDACRESRCRRQLGEPEEISGPEPRLKPFGPHERMKQHGCLVRAPLLHQQLAHDKLRVFSGKPLLADGEFRRRDEALCAGLVARSRHHACLEAQHRQRQRGLGERLGESCLRLLEIPDAHLLARAPVSERLRSLVLPLRQAAADIRIAPEMRQRLERNETRRSADIRVGGREVGGDQRGRPRAIGQRLAGYLHVACLRRRADRAEYQERGKSHTSAPL